MRVTLYPTLGFLLLQSSQPTSFEARLGGERLVPCASRGPAAEHLLPLGVVASWREILRDCFFSLRGPGGLCVEQFPSAFLPGRVRP